MNYLKIILMSVFSVLELFVLTKLIGNRQMSELNMFDYINGITIGSIAAEMATAIDEDVYAPALAMAVYGAVTVLISIISSKFINARKILEGESVIVFKDNNFIKKGMKKTKIDINELLVQCRVNGFFDLSQIDCIILEANGKISIMPKSDYRPLTPTDINIASTTEKAPVSVIIDGKIIQKNLELYGKDIKWLNQQLKSQNKNDISNIFYASLDPVRNTLSLYEQNFSENDVFL